MQDVGLNVVLALMLLVASILYIVSTVQIHNLFAHLEILRRLLEQGGFEIRELRGAKIAAAVKKLCHLLFATGIILFQICNEVIIYFCFILYIPGDRNCAVYSSCRCRCPKFPQIAIASLEI